MCEENLLPSLISFYHAHLREVVYPTLLIILQKSLFIEEIIFCLLQMLNMMRFIFDKIIDHLIYWKVLYCACDKHFYYIILLSSDA